MSAPYLRQPGPLAATRRDVQTTGFQPAQLRLSSTRRLLDVLEGLCRVGDSDDTFSGVGTLSGGDLASFSYYIPAECHDGTRAATYSEPHLGQAPAQLVTANMTIGRRDDELFVHCHALFVDAEDTLRGGHLIPDSVHLSRATSVNLRLSADAGWQVRQDPEINLPVFHLGPRASSELTAFDLTGEQNR